MSRDSSSYFINIMNIAHHIRDFPKVTLLLIAIAVAGCSGGDSDTQQAAQSDNATPSTTDTDGDSNAADQGSGPDDGTGEQAGDTLDQLADTVGQLADDGAADNTGGDDILPVDGSDPALAGGNDSGSGAPITDTGDIADTGITDGAVPPDTPDALAATNGGDSGRRRPTRRRLSDVLGETSAEWVPDIPVLTVNTQQQQQEIDGVTADINVTLPNAAQNDQLQDILVRLALNPDDTEAQNDMNVLVGVLEAQAETALNADQLREANTLLTATSALQPDSQRTAQLIQQLQGKVNVANLLAAAQRAFDAGQYLEPEDDNALGHFQAVLAADAGNENAQRGVAALQARLVELSIEAARELDFDRSNQLLTQAADLRDDSEAVAEARQQIAQFQDQRVQALNNSIAQAIDSGDFDTAESELGELVALGDYADQVAILRQSLNDARLYGGFQPGQVIRDPFNNSNRQAPAVVILPAGNFMMGSPDNENGRANNEGPLHRVGFVRGFAIGQRELTVGEFRLFINDTGYQTDAERFGNSSVYDEQSGRLTRRNRIDWSNDYLGGRAGDDMPVIHVSWNDARAYANWLSQQTSRTYRLPSEAEFEYATRAGNQGLYWWGNSTPSTVVTNTTGDGDVSSSRRRWTVAFDDYRDGYWGPAPTATFAVNPFGLYDINGNVSEWVEDCWHDTYVRAPGDGTAWVNPGCDRRVVRGGSWSSSPDQMRSAFRLAASPDTRGSRVGIRIVRDL